MEDLIREFLRPGDGDGYGDGSGDGSGYGYGSGYGSGDGSGDGSGYGDGSGITEINGLSVHLVDDVNTVFYHVRGNVAKGAILRDWIEIIPTTDQAATVIQGVKEWKR